MTRPAMPAAGDPNWGDPVRTAVYAVSDRVDAGPYIVKWTGSAWPARPAVSVVPAGFAFFVSTQDVNATAPTDANKQIGDVWLRHPDAT